MGLSVVDSATVSYSAGALYAPDIIARLDPQGSLGLVRIAVFCVSVPMWLRSGLLIVPCVTYTIMRAITLSWLHHMHSIHLACLRLDALSLSATDSHSAPTGRSSFPSRACSSSTNCTRK